MIKNEEEVELQSHLEEIDESMRDRSEYWEYMRYLDDQAANAYRANVEYEYYQEIETQQRIDDYFSGRR